MCQKNTINKRPNSLIFYGLLFAIPILLLGLSFIFDPINDVFLYRGLRALVSFCFIGASFYIYGRRLDSMIYWHMFFYGLASMFAVFFETIEVGVLCMLLNFVSFTFLIAFLYNRINFKLINPTFLIALILGILAHLWLIYYLLDMLYEIFSSLYLLIAICLSIIGSFTVCVLALIYNYDVKSIASILFTLFMVMLVFAETYRGSGHYGVIDPVAGQYFGRTLFLISYMLLFSFSFQEVFKNEKDLLS